MTRSQFSLSRKEGWRCYVDAAARRQPERLAPAEITALGSAAREEYNEARHDWHANFGILQTPQLASAHAELEQIVASNRQDSDRVRGAAVIDALPGLGKSTIANTYARAFDRKQILRLGTVTDQGHERIPVFRVGLTSNTTLRTLNRMICEFYGHPATDRANAAQLASHALDCVLNCDTRLGVIDDIHFIDPHRKDGMAVSNHLKWLANELPVTFIYVGVGLLERRFFADGLTGKNSAMAQTGRRWTRLAVPAFSVTDPERARQWGRLLVTTESRLVLARMQPETLTSIADYLFERTTGHIGSLMTLVVRGCYEAIVAGDEQLTVPLLEKIKIDEASEQSRKRTAAELATRDAGSPSIAKTACSFEGSEA
ncbi:ATP-binding protein [Streptacidiphilus sp. N1-10]|uniref:ATP-binding protein n=1 Tax=Streptacidiphilus jeojiensis TaxID=3229225 RepID=A0ABV6XXX8_9ACTN